MQKPLDMSELLNNVDQALASGEPLPQVGESLGSFPILTRGTPERMLFTFVEIDGYPILRLSMNGESKDLILNNDQVKLLLRQMTLWLTR